MKMYVLLLALIALPFSTFANVEEEIVYENEAYDEVLHEMFLKCVSTKRQCATAAQREGYTVSKVVRDSARCPQARKPLACIVKH